MMKNPTRFLLFFVVFASLFVSACTEQVPGAVIPPKKESTTYFLTLQSNLSDRLGDGDTYLYLDTPGSDNRTFYDFVGDDNK